MQLRHAVMSVAVASVFLTLGNEVHAQAPKIEVKLSGQVNRAILYADDGTEDEWFNTDNDNSSTRFRISAEGPAGPGLRAGALFEVEFQSNPTNEVSFADRSIDPELLERHLDVYFTGGWGTVRLGQGSGAADGASEVDLSGTSVAHYANIPLIGGAFQYRTVGMLSGVDIANSISNQDFEGRYDRLLYRTPSFSGFAGQMSWGNKETDVLEAALLYAAELGGWGELAGAIGYSEEDGDAARAVDEDEVFGGSISWLHPSGFNLTYTHTNRDIAQRDRKFNYFKTGYRVGKHAFSIDYGFGDDQAASGDEATMVGIAYVWTPVEWADLYALAKRHEFERSGADFDDLDFFMVGTRVKF